MLPRSLVQVAVSALSHHHRHRLPFGVSLRLASVEIYPIAKSVCSHRLHGIQRKLPITALSKHKVSFPSETDATLVALRTRLIDLHSNLMNLREHSAMLRDNVGPSRNATFPLFLSIHSTLAKLSEQLTTDLDRSQQEGLPYYAAVPNLPDPVVPELLRTRLDKDVEREFRTMTQAFKGDPTQKVLRYNQGVETVLKAVAEKREQLEKPRPTPPAPTAPSPAADAVLAAIVNGRNLSS